MQQQFCNMRMRIAACIENYAYAIYYRGVCPWLQTVKAIFEALLAVFAVKPEAEKAARLKSFES